MNKNSSKLTSANSNTQVNRVSRSSSKRGGLKQKDRTSEVNLLHDEAFDEQAKSVKPNRRSSEISGILHNLPQRITLSKEGNVQQSTIENEQQSSSIPNVS
mmetsp:Transcript_27529/g.31691  ORF Transcript_27529/g.31691 Transcript_27529/m.31691 type:complete len:101 (-) Transcript_27529:275-577(-)